MKKSKAIYFVFIMFFVFGCFQTNVFAKTTTLVFSDHDPETNNMVVGIFKPMFRMIEERTGGQVKIEEHYNGELVSLQDAYNAVIQGIVDIAVVRPAIMPDRFVLDGIIESPVYNIASHRPSRTYNDLFKKYQELRDEFKHVQPLLLYCMSPATLGTSKKPVSSFSDNKGLKMITAGPFPSERAKALGQIPVGCPPPEFYSMLEKGVADGGMVVTLPEMYTYKWKDVIKNITLIPTLRATNAVVMNKKKWEKLPADVKKVITEMNSELIDLADKSQTIAYNEAVERLSKEPDIKVIKLSSEETAKFVQADNPVRAAYIKSLNAKGLPATQFNADYIALEKKYSSDAYKFK
jgi:TRAP-type C4-dicarboxylate transport system substrate-binding protein